MKLKPSFAMLGRPLCLVNALALSAAASATSPELVDMSLEDLLNVEITGAARKSQHLNDVAAAVFVISREDIERSGATSIPEALRLAPGVAVARLANNRWAVSVRGFNSRFSNKLLVLMDGRSIYSPIFSGVLWEDNDTLLEDIDRIEVIRGPGAAMWGSNAVNGVINIITRRARDTQGGLLVAAGGSDERGLAALRYGGESGDGHFRVWGKAFARDEAVTPDGSYANDYWRAGRLGFRGDWAMGDGHRLTLSGQVFSGVTGDTWRLPDLRSPSGLTLSDVRQEGKGLHLLGRDEWMLAGGSEMAVQAYVDSTEIEIAGVFKERRTTADVDFQQRMLIGDRHDLIWGLGYRYSRDAIDSGNVIAIRRESRGFSLTSAFIQDEITLVPSELRMMLGTRLEYNSFTGFEPMPNARLIWTPTVSQSLWGSVSRAVRTPSRAELDAQVDFSVLPAGAPGNPSPLPILTRNVPAEGDLRNETVLAYEIGYRQQFGPSLSVDIAAFQDEYDDLRATTLGGTRLVLARPPYLIQSVFPDNSARARTRGIEIAADWYPLPWWRIQPIYSYIDLHAWSKTGDPGSISTVNTLNASDPQHQMSLRSSMSFAERQTFDLWLRYVSRLGDHGSPLFVPAYTTLDLRYAWRPTRDLELSLVGQNLLDGQHPEAIPTLLPSQALEIQRGVYLKAKWQF
ncbi:TonB-dependent receptor [Accumulibacter sp.]|uniref:TonB-dependent receptor plug domain-containing protein n=1 Tax=Accumulibacter sp. TaxID=2053492 RepID=UPI0026349929|nr:TonB-dependent receptor [Accumulibacter sp.]